MPAPLDYSQQPRRRSPFRLTPRKVIVLCVLMFGLAVFLRGGPLTSADIRLDTGDLRYCYLGIPLVYERMPEPQRSQLLALAANSKVLRPEWCKCATFPLRSSNNEDGMCRGLYYKASVWAAQDPQLARLLLEDVAANYIAAPNATQGSSASVGLLSGFFVQPDTTGKWVVKQGWRQDEEALEYAKAKGYNLPATAPSPLQPPQGRPTSNK
jgi:hypothetical protein